MRPLRLAAISSVRLLCYTVDSTTYEALGCAAALLGCGVAWQTIRVRLERFTFISLANLVAGMSTAQGTSLELTS
jgi:hypothetical protein